MDSDNSSDGEQNSKSGGYASSDEERSYEDSKHGKMPQSPPGSPSQDSQQNSHLSGSSPNRQSPTSSPARMRRSPSNSPSKDELSHHTPSSSPARKSPSESSNECSPSPSPAQGSPPGSPSKQDSLNRNPISPSAQATCTTSPQRPSPNSSPRAYCAPSSPQSGGTPPGGRHSDRESYSRRSHGKKSKRHAESDGNVSDGSDDGRSSISSSSSFGDVSEKRAVHVENGDKKEKGKFEPHKAEDLSDVSDLDSAAGDGSLDSLSDDEGSRKKKAKEDSKKSPSPVRMSLTSSLRKDIVSHSDEMEQLDFEAEEPQSKDDKEDGECAEIVQAVQAPQSAQPPGNSVAKSEGDDGELKKEEVEEGEITDEDENRPEETEPRPICRFYNRGQCTWGSSCRFLHPGVTDKGNYTMFDMVRPLVPTNGPPMYGSMMDPYRPPMERPMIPPVGPMYSSRKEEPPALESAWERGLRTAKEMMRKASKRKETDMDFEEKKMNLSLGQDELDKENDYYTRPASPALDDDLDRWSSKDPPESKHHRMVVTDRYDTMDPYYAHHREGRDRWARGHYDDMRDGYGREHMYDSRHPGPHHEPHMAYRAHMHPSGHHDGYYPDKYERKKKSQTVREVIVQHSRKPSYKDEKSSSGANRGRGDEWADPWMRSKSPTGGRKSRPRRQSYSSGSSYSSSRSRSSRSSYSSFYSRSGSRSRSRSRSKSRSMSGSRSRSRSPPHPSHSLRRAGAGAGAGPGRGGRGSPSQPRQRRTAPDPRVRGSRVASPEDKRSGHTSGTAPPSRKPRPPSPGASRKSGQAVGPAAGPGRVVGGKVRHSKSSRSSSSDSSGSSSDSSETSLSSSSSSRDPTPPPKPKAKVPMDERLMAQSTKIKAMDALKLSGQKQQIKLTLKTQGSSVPGGADDPRRSAVVAGKKRTAETPPPVEAAKTSAAAKPPAKKTTSRREELLKQLKAVEDAIARKRSKIT